MFDSWEEKRRNGYASSRGSLKIKGGMLPHRYSMGVTELYFDGKQPKQTRSVGRVLIYETDGNLQVFFKNREDEARYEFYGKIVDIYRTY
jgi:hypothetical protein